MRKLRRTRGGSPEDIPSDYETLEVPVDPRGSSVGSPEVGILPEEGTSSVVVHPDYQGLETCYNPEAVAVSELTGSFSSTNDIGEEPDVSEPVTPTSSAPDSPRVERVITENLPSGLIAIEELAPEEEERGVFVSEGQPVIDLSERESIFYSPPRNTPWPLYFIKNNFLSKDNQRNNSLCLSKHTNMTTLYVHEKLFLFQNTSKAT